MKKNWTEALIHIAVWACLIFLPMLTQMENPHFQARHLTHTWFMLLELMLTFYFNYLWCIDRMLFRRKWWWFVLVNVAGFFAMFELTGWISYIVDQALGMIYERPPMRFRGMFMYNDVIYYVMGTGAALGLRYSKHLQHSEMERKKLESEKLESEITLLKYQMQPHFFFNTLNNIYSLISRSPVKAQNAVHSLSKMMRYILYENTSATIDLSKEITFMENYSKLMQLRLSDEVDVVRNFPQDVDGIDVPPLLFIPLLENAFKHGTLPCEGQRFIHCQMQIEGKRLTFVVENSLSTEVANEDRSHSGIGLTNLRKRLFILYEKDFEFSAQPNADNTIFVARLVIPLA